jgi:hypothetical protein
LMVLVSVDGVESFEIEGVVASGFEVFVTIHFISIVCTLADWF